MSNDSSIDATGGIDKILSSFELKMHEQNESLTAKSSENSIQSIFGREKYNFNYK